MKVIPEHSHCVGCGIVLPSGIEICRKCIQEDMKESHASSEPYYERVIQEVSK